MLIIIIQEIIIPIEFHPHHKIEISYNNNKINMNNKNNKDIIINRIKEFLLKIIQTIQIKSNHKIKLAEYHPHHQVVRIFLNNLVINMKTNNLNINLNNKWIQRRIFHLLLSKDNIMNNSNKIIHPIIQKGHTNNNQTTK